MYIVSNVYSSISMSFRLWGSADGVCAAADHGTGRRLRHRHTQEDDGGRCMLTLMRLMSIGHKASVKWQMVLKGNKLKYRVAHLLRERNMLTSNSKYRWWPGSEDKVTAKRSFKFGVNILFP